MSTAQKVLQHLGLGESRDNQYKLNSPFRHGSDSQGFSLKIDDDEHGTWYDHVSGEKGSLYELAKRLGIELPKHGAVADTSKASSFEQFAEQHGVSVDVYKRAGWSATTYSKYPALAFTTKTGIRYRVFGGNSKYIHGKGYVSSWYKLDEAIAIADAGGYPLVLCNGEASTVVAQHYKIPATCVTGGSERQIPEDLVQELKNKYKGEIVIALDCDDKGRKASIKLHTQLKSLGYATKVVNMGLDNKGDLADYLRLWSPEKLYELPDTIATELVVQAPKTTTASELQMLDVPPLEYIVDDLMVPGCYLLAGAPKSRKSFAALHLAIAIASGSVAFSRFETKKSGVLYLDLEMSQNSVYRRMSAMLQQERKRWPAQLHFGFGDDWQYRGGEAIAQLELWLDSHSDVKLVIIDVLAQWREHVDPRTPVYTADYDALKQIQRLATRRGIAIMVVHHTNKAKMSKGDNPFDKISGSTGIQGAVDAMWLLTKDPEDQYSTILQMTDRNIHDVDKLELKWDDYLGCHVLDPKLRVLESSSSERRAIYEALAQNDLSMTPSEIAIAVGKSDGQVKKLLPRLVQDKLIEKVGYGRYKASLIESGNSGNSGYFGNSLHSGNSSDDEVDEIDSKSYQELPSVTKSYQRVTAGFTALESSKPTKSDQSDRFCIAVKDYLDYEKEPQSLMAILSVVGKRHEHEEIRQVIEDMVKCKELEWVDDKKKVRLINSY